MEEQGNSYGVWLVHVLLTPNSASLHWGLLASRDAPDGAWPSANLQSVLW
jgi:hypothetical protein